MKLSLEDGKVFLHKSACTEGAEALNCQYAIIDILHHEMCLGEKWEWEKTLKNTWYV